MAIKPKGRKTGEAAGLARNAGAMGSVLKAFEALEVFGRLRRPLGVAELSRETGQPKSSLHRVLTTLVHAGVVEQTEGSLYRLTLKLWRLGVPALADVDLVQVAHPYLEALCRAADETVHLAILEPGGGIVYLTKVESPRSIRVQTQIGRVSPSWCTATGRTLLADHPAMRDRVLAESKTKLTPDTEIDPDRLRALIDRAAADGIAVTKGENHPEMGGIAAAIRDHTGEAVASVGLGVPAFRMDDELVRRCAPLVIRAAEEISAALDYRPAAVSRGL